VIRLGAPSSDPAGCCLETTFKGHQRRLTIRAWHPLVNVPAQHFTLAELAHALGLIVPARSEKKRGRNKI
jgi:hypothetical protein